MRISFTDHAVDRFIQFHTDGSPSHVDARVLLEQHAPNAVKIREKTLLGDQQWRIEALGCVVVTKPDDGLHVAVTILPRFNRGGASREELEAVEEKQAELRVRGNALRQEHAAAVVECVKARNTTKAELTAAAVARAAAGVAERAAERVERVAERTARITEAQVRVDELKLQLAILHQEAQILGSVTKAVRVQAAAMSNVSAYKEAARIAIRFLMASQDGWTGDAAAMAREAICAIGPGLTELAFYACKSEPTE